MKIEAKRKLTLAICCSAHAVQDGLGAAIYILLPILAQVFGLSYAQVGLLRAAESTTATLFELPSGILSEKFGERRLLVFGLLCAGIGYLYLATVSNVWIILIAFLIIGVGSAFQHALSSSLISNNFDDKGRRSALGIYNSSGDAGKLIFTGVLSLATGIGIAWQGIVVLFGMVTLAFAVLLWVALRRASVGAPQPAVSTTEEITTTGNWGIKNRTGFANLCLTVFIDTSVQSGFLVFIVFIIADKGVSTSFAAFALVLTLIGGMFGKAGCGYLSQRIGIRYAFIVTQCATAAGLIALLFAPAPVAFIVLPILGMFLQGSTSITYGSIADLIRSDRQSRGFAMIYSVSSLSAIAGPIAFGVISDHFSLNASLLAMAIVSLLAIVPSLFLTHDTSAPSLP